MVRGTEPVHLPRLGLGQRCRRRPRRFCFILLTVALLRSIALGTSVMSSLIRTIPPVSLATSVPLPIAIPTSAAANAGASFIPSQPLRLSFRSSEASSRYPLSDPGGRWRLSCQCREFALSLLRFFHYRL